MRKTCANSHSRVIIEDTEGAESLVIEETGELHPLSYIQRFALISVYE